MKEEYNLETMLQILRGFMLNMETKLSVFLESNDIQDAKPIADIANESVSETITLLRKQFIIKHFNAKKLGGITGDVPLSFKSDKEHCSEEDSF